MSTTAGPAEVRVASRLPLTRAGRQVVDAVLRAGGRPYLVGGTVRDLLTDRTAVSKDVDVEVFDLDLDDLVDALRAVGDVDEVGRSFAVLKVRVSGEDVDVSLPRREVKVGAGHRGFEVVADPRASLAEASGRRDFTLNALLYDPVAGEVVDCWGGLDDLADGVLRHTTAAFAEDPLRVLRAVQFSARFGYRLHPDTARLCRELVPAHSELPPERLWVEWEKVGAKGRHLSLALETLRTTGWDVHYPQLARLQGVPQDPRWHPEGDVWTHSGLAGDKAAELADAAGLTGRDRAVVVLGALLHDVGKHEHTQQHDDGRITSVGHAAGGVAPALELLAAIDAPSDVRQRIAPIVREHMCATGVVPTTAVVRRLARRLAPASVHEWSLVCGADKGGRGAGSRPDETPAWVALAEEAGVGREPQKPLLRGQHLMALGHRPGPGFRRVVDASVEAQDEGAFSDEAGAAAWLGEAERDGRLAVWLEAGRGEAERKQSGPRRRRGSRPAEAGGPA